MFCSERAEEFALKGTHASRLPRVVSYRWTKIQSVLVDPWGYSTRPVADLPGASLLLGLLKCVFMQNRHFVIEVTLEGQELQKSSAFPHNAISILNRGYGGSQTTRDGRSIHA